MSDRPGFDPYEVLGVHRGATPLQVARAHRRLAKRYHPDLHPDSGADSAMRRINEAWVILSTPSRRAAFDRTNPGAGLPRGAHWTASRASVDLGRRAAAPRETAWTARADATGGYGSVRRAAASTASGHAGFARRSAEAAAPASVRRPPAPDDAAAPASFRDSPWAAVAIAVILVCFVLLAAGLGSAYYAQQLQNQPMEGY